MLVLHVLPQSDDGGRPKSQAASGDDHGRFRHHSPS